MVHLLYLFAGYLATFGSSTSICSSYRVGYKITPHRSTERQLTPYKPFHLRDGLSPQEDHHRAVAAVIRGLPPDWKRPLGRLSHTWLRAVHGVRPLANRTLASQLPSWRKAAIRDDWRRIVDTATLQRSGVCYHFCYERRRMVYLGKFDSCTSHSMSVHIQN